MECRSLLRDERMHVQGGFCARVELPLNQWIIKSVDELSQKVDEAIEALKLNEASQSLYQFIWLLRLVFGVLKAISSR